MSEPQHSDRVDIFEAVWTNEAFRREVMTGTLQQVVVMTIQPGDEIGEEVHAETDQSLVIIDGTGEAQLDGASFPIRPNELVLVRAGVRHNFVNTGDVPLRLITVYSPPEHPAGTVHKTKAEADAAEHH